MTEVKYDILFSVRYRHRFFEGNKLRCFTTKPDVSCHKFLIGNKLVFKPQPDGFVVFYESRNGANQNERAALLDHVSTLRFLITLEDEHFYNYTSAYIGRVSRLVSYFHNDLSQREDPAYPQLLHAGEYVSNKDLSTPQLAGAQYLSKPFGIIDIKLVSDLQTEYAVQFKEKTTYWRYHLVSDHLKGLDQPGIVGPEQFSAPTKTILPNAQEAMTFVSENPIALSEKNKQSFQLVENYERGAGRHKVVMRSLPCPDARNISRIRTGTEKEQADYSEIFIY